MRSSNQIPKSHRTHTQHVHFVPYSRLDFPQDLTCRESTRYRDRYSWVGAALFQYQTETTYTFLPLSTEKGNFKRNLCCLRSWSMTRWSRTVTEHIHGYGLQFKTKLSVHSPDEKVTCENRRGPSKFDGKLLISHENVSPVTLTPSKYRCIME